MHERPGEAALCVESILNCFDRKEVYISIDCNDTSLKPKQFARISYDALSIQERFDLNFEYSGPKDIYWVGLRHIDAWHNLTLDCITNSDADYIIYMHADTLVLSREGILEVIKPLNSRSINFTCQGLGLTLSQGLSDLFFAADLSFLRKNNIFNFEYEDLYLNTKPSIHTWLMDTIRWRAGLRQLHIHEAHDYNLLLSGVNRNPWLGPAWANCYNPNYSYIHYGDHEPEYKHLLSFYLQKYGHNSPAIKKFIKSHPPITLKISSRSNFEAYPNSPKWRKNLTQPTLRKRMEKKWRNHQTSKGVFKEIEKKLNIRLPHVLDLGLLRKKGPPPHDL